MSWSSEIYCTFDHHYVNVREEFDRYEYVISFNSKIKSKN